MRIAVITPSLPSRGGKLADAVKSVGGQNLLPYRHMVEIDHGREGAATVRNRLVYDAWDADYVAFLDDDDVLYPHHLSDLAAVATQRNADVVYPFCDVVGRDGWNPNRDFDSEALRQGNYIPVTVLVRRMMFQAVGGFPGDTEQGWEDHGLWLRILNAGGRFVCHPHRTWRYQLHEGSKTFAGETEAF